MSGVRTSRLPAGALALCLLAGLAADRALFHTPPPDTEQYHRAVAAAGPTVPYRIESWVGRDGELPPDVQRLLKPNLLIARDYLNISTGQTARLLLVHCRDARDLIGHYPPACYDRRGWSQESTRPRDWSGDGILARGTRYEFASPESRRIGVDNFMVLPGGATGRDMDAVHAAASSPGRKFFGAAQVQVVCDAAATDAQRDDAVRMALTASRSVIERIQTGRKDE